MAKKRINMRDLIILPFFVAAMLIFAGLLIGDIAILGNLIVISIFVVIIPVFIFKYTQLMWIRSVEAQFPAFIRDLADSIRSGLSLNESIEVVSGSKYGKLTEEIINMKNRLSWGTPFLRVLEIFEQKTRKSKLINEAIGIFREAYMTGSDMAGTLDSINEEITMLMEAEAEKSSMVKQHIFIMYGVFAMFLGTSALIINVMVPMINSQVSVETPTASGGMFSTSLQNQLITSPCPAPDERNTPTQAGICPLFDGANILLGVSTDSTGSYYMGLLFLAVIMQGFCIGLIAGQLSENSVLAGLKHSLIMVIIAFASFVFLVRAGFLGV